MKILTFIGGSKLIKLKVDNNKKIWGYRYDLKVWIPVGKVEKIYISEEDLNFLKNNDMKGIINEIKKKMAKGGAKKVKEE